MSTSASRPVERVGSSTAVPARAVGRSTAGRPGGTARVVRTRPDRRVPIQDRMTPARWVIWAAMVLGGLVMVFPVYWVFVTAISPGGLAQTSGFSLWPHRVDLGVFAKAFADQPVLTWLVNSVVIAVAGVVISVFISVLAGYAFAKFSFRGRNLLFGAMLVTIMVPIQVVMVPEFVIISKLGLVGTPWAVILPSAAQAVSIFMARQYIQAIPTELIEAARVDGAGEFRTFRTVVLPACGPLVAVLTILTFVWRWNDFVWPLVALQKPESYTISVGLSSLNGSYSHPWDEIMAITLISMIPVMIVFFVFQRQFVQGIAESGIK
ncbi:carbohydrate ABC transporter permease [Curtobacterium sp. MCBD17_040]|uniref:carbohydrate ABC transporter permease n=1 Tax=Curtobacterium sp. MCBD17_040 TaxID=2175674 RepID=UPI0021ACCB3C|nr:carbohydrate ABC transporter permease [Curtobacterium sp. MCBD17_040]WIB64938.1 carbohydrate ABC transporter permease [Curtobacterium sp. MCBD17_040]